MRELENAIERAIVLSDSDSVQPDDLPDPILEKDPPAGVTAVQYHANVKEFKKQLILNAMGAAKGNYTEAARFLGVHPNYLHRLIRNLGLKELIASARNLRGGSRERFRRQTVSRPPGRLEIHGRLSSSRVAGFT